MRSSISSFGIGGCGGSSSSSDGGVESESGGGGACSVERDGATERGSEHGGGDEGGWRFGGMKCKCNCYCQVEFGRAVLGKVLHSRVTKVVLPNPCHPNTIQQCMSLP